VLVIDDEEEVARILAKALRREFEAEAVFDGQQALARLLTDPGIDLAFCDLMMDGLSGMDLHAALTARAPAQASKLVFMTGGAYTPQAAAFLSGRADAVVYKPFDVLAEARRRLGARGE
jgi:two-component system NtrC family sensor kinase